MVETVHDRLIRARLDLETCQERCAAMEGVVEAAEKLMVKSVVMAWQGGSNWDALHKALAALKETK